MKRLVLSAIVIIAFVFLSSCDDTLNPNAPFRERFSLNGIMRSDTSFQVITISHSYQPSDNNPLSYTEDPSITNAEVNVYYNNKLYRMRDTSIARNDTSHYNTSVRFYYNPELKPEPNKSIEVDAILPNGLLLQSICFTPNVEKIGFFSYENPRLIPDGTSSKIRLAWKDLGEVLHDYKLLLKYRVKGDSTLHTKEIPIAYANIPDKPTPVYPIPIEDPKLDFNVETLTRFLNNFPEEGRTKKDYTFEGIDFVLIVYDENLSKYYYSIRQASDGFTVRLDSPDYTNVKGGFGIFGSYVKTIYELKIRADYLTSLGY